MSTGLFMQALRHLALVSYISGSGTTAGTTKIDLKPQVWRVHIASFFRRNSSIFYDRFMYQRIPLHERRKYFCLYFVWMMDPAAWQWQAVHAVA